MSITDELRGWAEGDALRAGMSLRTARDQALAIADRIDAEHQKAEDEWRYKNGDMWLKGYNVCHKELMEGHPVIAADLESAGWLKLPVDADGEIIRMGDMMERGKARGHVIALMLCKYPKKWSGGLHWAVQLEGEQAPTALDAFFRHYHEPTVEDRLWELIDALGIDRDKCSPVMVENAARELQLREGA